MKPKKHCNEAEHHINDQVNKEIIDAAYIDFSKLQFPAFPFLGMLFYIFYGKINTYHLLIWLIVSLILHSIPFKLKQIYFKENPKPNNLKKWEIYLIINIFLLAISSSIPSVFAINLSMDLYKTIIFLSLLTILIFSSYGYQKGYAAICFPMAFICGITLIIKFEDQKYFGIISLFIAFIFFSINHRFSKTFRKSIEIQFKNKKLIKSLSLEKEKAIRASNEKSIFLASANHDLRQPLQTISLYIDTLKETKLEKEKVNLIDNIHNALNDTNHLLDSLTELSRADSETIKPNISNFYLKDITKKLSAKYKKISEYKKIDFTNNTNATTIVKSDIMLLERIIENLLSNAFRYTQTGSITISSKTEENKVTIDIIDTGCGIQAAEKNKIFMPFYQIGNKQRDRHNGIGLGLSIVKKFCQLLNHDIQVDSTFKKGSKFSITLDSGFDKDTIKINPEKNHVGHTNLDINILFIDDDYQIREAIKPIFEAWGCQFNIASSRKEAINIIQKNQHPDIIVCDYRLQDLTTGIDTIIEIRKETKDNIPAILLTGDTNENVIADINKHGFSLFHKPINAGKLKKMIAFHTNTI